MSTLIAESIRPKTQSVYLSHLEKLLAWLRQPTVPRWDVETLDEVLEDYLCEPYDQNRPYVMGNRTVTVTMWA